MFSARNGSARALLAAAGAIGLMALAGTAHAQAVVVRSSGPSVAAYPQGKKLPAGAKVTLRAGDKLTVLDKSGTRVLSGPGAFPLDGTVAHDATAGARLAGVMTGGAARTRTGAVRGAVTRPASAKPTGPDSIWYVDVSKGGTYCIANPASVVLWRPNRAEAATGKLSRDKGTPVEVSWKAGNPLKLWPVAQLPLVEGGKYVFSDPVGPNVAITVHLVGDVPADELGVASLFADKGCMAQLDVFANAAMAAAAAGG